ncbi:MAG: GNAT family N-acetyltransferase [Gammaproteobacteria bacterium]|nr:GNAT family N-acetyltransferase [Gammaproteobacteria bacterium]
MKVIDLYCGGRGEMANSLAEVCGLKGLELQEFLRRFLWTPAYCLQDNLPQYLFPIESRMRVSVIGFSPSSYKIENIQNSFLRIPVSSNWYLDFSLYENFSDYFTKLSQKMKKQLRWLKNSYQHQDFRFIPVRGREDLEAFMSLYQAKWPRSAWARQLKEPLFKAYLFLESCGWNHSYLLKDREGEVVAGSLGYQTGHTFNLHMLVHQQNGKYDKYSPGFFLAFWLIQHLMEETALSGCWFGPGKFDYKERLLCQAFPTYRYEKIAWNNLSGLSGLLFRYCKEKVRGYFNRT